MIELNGEGRAGVPASRTSTGNLSLKGGADTSSQSSYPEFLVPGHTPNKRIWSQSKNTDKRAKVAQVDEL